MKEIQLSVVATSRNDNHGGSLLYRMQHFVDGFVTQCNKHALQAELILVEWNPPDDRPPLAEALQFPKETGCCEIRIIRVPKELHASFAHADKIPLFQMIGKNVGIRRARGKFVLATNIDILFSDTLVKYLRDKLTRGALYRVDRLDVPSQLPEKQTLEEILRFCDSNYFRINGKFGTKIKIDGKWIDEADIGKSDTKQNTSILHLFEMIRPSIKNVGVFCQKLMDLSLRKLARHALFLSRTICHKLMDFSLRKLAHHALFLSRTIGTFFYIKFIGFSRFLKKVKIRFFLKLHTNACGDFTLLSREDWMEQRGYCEWPIFSWHLDSVFLFQAKLNGIKQEILSRDCPIYHIEHGKGSGYTPGAADLLFKRLADNNIPFIHNHQLPEMIHQMHMMNKQGQKIIYNDEKWGLADIDLEEVTL